MQGISGRVAERSIIVSKKKRISVQNQNTTQKGAVETGAEVQDRREAKKAAVLGTEKKRRPPLYAILAIAFLIITGITYVIVSRSQDKGAEVAASFSADAAGSQITYPTGLFDDGSARHYEYRDGDFTIKYFILKSSDGIIRAAFDACDVCWRAGKGYVQSGDVMICRNCGRRFASVLVNEVKGGCNPAPLKRIIENGKLIIKVTDILEGKQFFNFSGKV